MEVVRFKRKKRKRPTKLLPAMICKNFDSHILYIHAIQRPLYIKMEMKATSENNLLPEPVGKKIDPTCRGPKRYETLCYFKPLAVPVWYSSSITVQVNSTKKKYTENVTYKNKFVPYRYIEKMTTIISSSNRRKNFVSNLGIQLEVPEEHIISLEPQQKSANPLFTTDRSIKVDSYC